MIHSLAKCISQGWLLASLGSYCRPTLSQILCQGLSDIGHTHFSNQLTVFTVLAISHRRPRHLSIFKDPCVGLKMVGQGSSQNMSSSCVFSVLENILLHHQKSLTRLALLPLHDLSIIS